MPMPIPPIDDDYKYRYFGESRGHLHLAHYRINSGTPRFDVYEMEMDCSGWFVKFRVNFSTIHHAFPMTLQEEGYYLSALCIVRGVSDKESYVVMEIRGAIIRYNFNTLEKICDTQMELEGLQNAL
ncbi:hypothetical protein L484_003422 [Morus notabilis]|uniref:F-box protein n=1 Tax=Morus notabilis TaxID=981085 RepID=W9SC14_9ROSA|nr:hypothetical protein L484_003422 [Morus notabilis]